MALKRVSRETKKTLLGHTPAQRKAFEYFAKRHPYWKMRSIHYARRVGFWSCLVGAVSDHSSPSQVHGKRKRKRGK